MLNTVTFSHSGSLTEFNEHEDKRRKRCRNTGENTFHMWMSQDTSKWTQCLARKQQRWTHCTALRVDILSHGLERMRRKQIKSNHIHICYLYTCSRGNSPCRGKRGSAIWRKYKREINSKDVSLTGRSKFSGVTRTFQCVRWKVVIQSLVRYKKGKKRNRILK